MCDLVTDKRERESEGEREGGGGGGKKEDPVRMSYSCRFKCQTTWREW